MRKRKNVSLCLPLDTKKLDAILDKRGYVIVQAKLNGLHALWDGSRLLSATGLPFPCLPTLHQHLLNLYPGVPVEGELYVHDWPRQEIQSIVRRTRNVHPQEGNIQIWLFDWLGDKSLSYANRFQRLGSKNAHVVCVPSKIGTTLHNCMNIAQRFVDLGFEGAVFKDPLAPWIEGKGWHSMKWKPEHVDQVTVIDIVEGTGKYDGTMGAVVVEDSDGRRYSIGSFKMNDLERYKYWRMRDQLIGGTCKISYTDVSADGVPSAAVLLSFEGNVSAGG